MSIYIANYNKNLIQVFRKKLIYSIFLCSISFGIALGALLLAFQKYQQKTSIAYIHHQGTTLQVMVRTQSKNQP
jgi:hypothetical protein